MSNQLLILRTATTGVTEVSTFAQLQAALDAVAVAEPNAQGGTVPNRSKPILLRNTIALADQLDVPGNAIILGSGAGGGLTWTGATPPIMFYSAVGNGATSRIVIDGVTIYAPNASAPWGWDRANHAGNANNYVFRNMKLTAAGVHLNCGAPGDGRLYQPVFDNIQCFGAGQMVGGIDASNAIIAGGGTPILGRFSECKYSGQCSSDYIVNLLSAEATFQNCWVEPINNGFIRTTGSFGFLRWDSYCERDGTFTDPPYLFTGFNNRVVCDVLTFLQPTLKAQLSGGARLCFRNPDMNISNAGVAIDFTSLTASSTTDLQTIRDSLVLDSTSRVMWPGGYVTSTGVTLYDKTAV